MPSTSLGRLLLLLALLSPAAASARMGGGESYGGGGSSSSSSSSFSSSSSSSGGGGELNLPLVLGIFAIPVVFLIGFSIVVKRQEKRAAAALAATLTEFRRTDPGFDLDVLRERTKQVFLRCQEAWFRRELGPVRTLMSDASYQRLKTQLELMQALGVRDAIAKVTVDEVELDDLSRGPFFDTVKLTIRAAMKDTEVPSTASDDEARKAAEAADLEEFSEVWSFVRRPGARASSAGALLEGKCPGCGAPIEAAETSACGHCKAIVNSGNYDWTLAEITQPLEDDTRLDEAEIEGLAEARRSDPALNLQLLEDRAALVFWQWIAAQVEGEARRLAKLAAPEFVGAFADALEHLNQAGKRRLFMDCAVGAVNVQRFRREGERLLTEVEIRWSAASAALPMGEKFGTFEPALRHTLLTLARAQSARTRTDEGMSACRCPACRAPLSDSLTAACDYCGVPLGQGEDWVLVSESTRVEAAEEA